MIDRWMDVLYKKKPYDNMIPISLKKVKSYY